MLSEFVCDSSQARKLVCYLVLKLCVQDNGMYGGMQRRGAGGSGRGYRGKFIELVRCLHYAFRERYYAVAVFCLHLYTADHITAQTTLLTSSALKVSNGFSESFRPCGMLTKGTGRHFILLSSIALMLATQERI